MWNFLQVSNFPHILYFFCGLSHEFIFKRYQNIFIILNYWIQDFLFSLEKFVNKTTLYFLSFCVFEIF